MTRLSKTRCYDIRQNSRIKAQGCFTSNRVPVFLRFTRNYSQNLLPFEGRSPINNPRQLAPNGLK